MLNLNKLKRLKPQYFAGQSVCNNIMCTGIFLVWMLPSFAVKNAKRKVSKPPRGFKYLSQHNKTAGRVRK